MLERINDHVAFDLAVIESVIQQRSRFNPEKTKLAINISISSLLNDEFIDACEKIFEHEKNVILELTRHDTTSDFSRIQAAIKQLKAKDVQFAQLNLLKPFGTMTYQGFYFSKPISIEDVKQTASNIDSYKNKTKSFCNLLDQAIYDMNRAKDQHEIKRAMQHLMKIEHYNTVGISPNFLMFIMNCYF